MNWKDDIAGVNEMAKKWDISPHYLKYLCAKEKVDCVKIGKTWVLNSKQPRPDIKHYHWNKRKSD